MRRPKHILVIDGAQELHGLYREILEDGGYRVSFADTAISPDDISGATPDLIVLEPMVGPGDQGWHLLRRLGAAQSKAAPPVVVCTGAACRVREEAEHLARGAVGLVLKPFDIDELLHEIVHHAEMDVP